MSLDTIMECVLDAITEVNETLDSDKRLDPVPQTVIVGEGGTLDSLGVVNLSVAIEENVERRLGYDVSVIDLVTSSEQAVWTVANLAGIIAQQVESGV